MAEKGNLKILNVTLNIVNGTNSDFVFTVPSGGDAEVVESTYHLLRSVPLIPGVADWGSEDVVIEELSIIKRGSTERTSLLDGTPNIKEFAGSGMLPRIFTVVETSQNNEDVIIRVANNDTVPVRVSLTIYLLVKTKVRNIAAEPSEREVLPGVR